MIGRNNPFNVRFSGGNKWKGQIGVSNGFVNFSTIDYGVRCAAYLLMQSYQRKGLKTYAELISHFAPPSENDTQAYIDFVTSKLHVFPFDIPSTKERFAGMLRYMWIMEQGYASKPQPYSTRAILDIIHKFNLTIYKR